MHLKASLWAILYQYFALGSQCWSVLLWLSLADFSILNRDVKLLKVKTAFKIFCLNLKYVKKTIGFYFSALRSRV